MGPQLTIDSLVADVESDPRLTGLVDDGLSARLGAMVDSVNAAVANAPGLYAAAQAQLGGVLRRRLALAADRRDFPAIATERIEQPIFVVGFPRTGTTLLHALLAEAPETRAPRLWEVRNPSPPPGPEETEAARIALGDIDAREWCATIPGLMTAHPYFDKGGRVIVEDEEIMALDFQSAYPTWYAKLPVVLLGVTTSDPSSGYRFHHQFLQHLQWCRPSQRWALKGTTHQFLLETLWSEYPDARCIWAHRDPAETYASLLELNSLVNVGLAGHVDRPALAEAMLADIQASLDHTLASPVLDDPRLAHVRYVDLVADPIGTIERVYAHWGLAWTAEHGARMRRWLDDPGSRSDRHGKFRYSLEPFGLDESGVRKRFSGYIDRFL